MVAKKPTHYMRRIMEGQSYAGRLYDVGQVMELVGGGNDDKLIRLGYIAEVPKNAELVQCGQCGAEFIETQFRTMHGNKRHRPAEETVIMSDEQEEALIRTEARKLDQIAPFFLPDETPVEISTETRVEA